MTDKVEDIIETLFAKSFAEQAVDAWTKEFPDDHNSDALYHEVNYLETLMEGFEVGAFTKKAHPQICNCGTCQDVMKAATRMYLQMREHQCFSWAMQIHSALLSLMLAETVLQVTTIDNVMVEGKAGPGFKITDPVKGLDRKQQLEGIIISAVLGQQRDQIATIMHTAMLQNKELFMPFFKQVDEMAKSDKLR